VSKWLKTAFLAGLLMGAAYYFGTICGQVGQAYELILSPSRELLSLLGRFLLAAGALAVTGGLVTALLRPVWVGIIAFVLSGATLLWGWEVTALSGILAAVYVVAGSLYAAGVARELEERISFSVRPIGEGQGTLLMALVLVACGSLYQGCAAQIEEEGFSIPESYIEMFMDQMEKQIEARLPEGEREQVLVEFRKEFPRAIDGFFERTVKPYERYIPLVLAAGVFMQLVTVTRLLGWVPTMVLSGVFPLLELLGVTEVTIETLDVERLVIG